MPRREYRNGPLPTRDVAGEWDRRDEEGDPRTYQTHETGFCHCGMDTFIRPGVAICPMHPVYPDDEDY